MWGNVKSSCKAPETTPATQKRLLSDLRRLQQEPIALAAAQPCSDADLTLWDGVVGVEMEVTHFGRVTVPLHFLIDFPFDYPHSAPNIGFSFEFRYRGGAEYIMPDGRLKGKKVICLDVLGNFGNYHQEWKSTVGSGWSPAYTVTTLLVQLQSVLCDLGVQMSQSERDVAYQSAVRFCEQKPSSILQLLDEDDIRDQRERGRIESQVSTLCAGDLSLASRVLQFGDKIGAFHDSSKSEELLILLEDFAKLHSKASADSVSKSTSGGGSCTEVTRSEVDPNICCFATGKSYIETILGVGVSRERRNLSTAAELVSKDAFDDGLRQSTNKTPFEFFLPVWINKAHAEQNESWRAAVRSSYLEIGTKVFDVHDDDQAIMEVFPRLINQMIVEIMRPDASKSAAIATFEAMCNFWRTMRWLVDTRPSLRNNASKVLEKFVADESFRHKDVTPDLGMLLVLFTVLQGHSGCPAKEQFVRAYADENSIRWVMWWQRSGTKPEDKAVFQATQVSREIFMFQMLVVELIIGDVDVTLKDIDSTNCKLPDRLETLQGQWRERKTSTRSWADYFRHIGLSRPPFDSSSTWIADCVSRAAAKGPKYGGAKGDGKGGSKGNGKGDGKGGKGKGGYRSGRY